MIRALGRANALLQTTSIPEPLYGRLNEARAEWDVTKLLDQNQTPAFNINDFKELLGRNPPKWNPFPVGEWHDLCVRKVQDTDNAFQIVPRAYGRCVYNFGAFSRWCATVLSERVGEHFITLVGHEIITSQFFQLDKPFTDEKVECMRIRLEGMNTARTEITEVPTTSLVPVYDSFAQWPKTAALETGTLDVLSFHNLLREASSTSTWQPFHFSKWFTEEGVVLYVKKVQDSASDFQIVPTVHGKQVNNFVLFRAWCTVQFHERKKDLTQIQLAVDGQSLVADTETVSFGNEDVECARITFNT